MWPTPPSSASPPANARTTATSATPPSPSIRPLPASECKDASDLGDTLVTVDVPPLAPAQVHHALDAGAACARVLQKRGLVWAVLLVCQGQWRRVEPLCSKSLDIALPEAVGSVFA